MGLRLEDIIILYLYFYSIIDILFPDQWGIMMLLDSKICSTEK